MYILSTIIFLCRRLYNNSIYMDSHCIHIYIYVISTYKRSYNKYTSVYVICTPMWINFNRKNDDNNLLFDIGCVLLARIVYNKSYEVKSN